MGLILEGIFKEGLDSMIAAIENRENIVKWSSFIRGDYGTRTLLHSAPLKVINFIKKYLLD